MKKILCALSACLLMTGVVEADIDWGSIMDITDSATDVSSAGTSIWAYSMDSGGGTNTVNGVDFVQSNGSADGNFSISVELTTTTSYGKKGAASDALYNSILEGGSWATTTATNELTLSNLEIGQKYQVQLWAHDSRGAAGKSVDLSGNSDMTDSVNLDYNVTDTAGDFGQYVIGTFTASADTQIIYANSATGNFQLNAIQLSAIPEPATIGLLGLGSVGLLLRRKRNR